MNLKRITLDDTVEETVNKINENTTDIEENVSRLEADFISYKDNITLKTSKIEKELNDYKATMQQVNINQESKQKAAGYRVISLPPNAAEGQVSSVGIKGLTATNLVKNGDFSNGTAEWTTHQGNITVTNGVLHFRPLSPSARLFNRFSIIAGNKYYLKHKNLQIDKPENKNTLVITTGMDAFQLVESLTSGNVDEKLGDYSLIFEPTENANGIRYHFGTYNTDTDETTYTLESMLCINLTQTFGAGNEPTKEECDQIFANYFEGTKSTISGSRLKSVGKNLLNLSNGQQTINGITIVVDDGEVLINGTTTNNVWIKLTGGFEATSSRLARWRNDSLRIKPGNYTLSRNNISGTGTSMSLAIRNQNDEMAIGVTQSINSQTGFLDDNLSYVYLFIASDAVFNNYRFRPQLEKGDQATDYEPYKESNAYVIATDKDTGKILELRSLPNGTKDEIDTTQGKLIKRISDEYTIKVTDIGSLNRDLTNVDQVSVVLPPDFVKSHGMGKFKSELREVDRNDRDNINSIGALSNFGDGTLRYIIEKGTTLEQAKQQLAGTTLTYQLAEPIEIPVQVSGSLVSHPNGTVYVEPIVADAGVYTDKIEVLHQDLPIKALEKLSKVDFMTGVETELDISKAEISEDKLSFTHPELNAGDIVFFEYEYDVESTEGETEVEYYDSRYVVKDDVTGKFYKWNVKVSNGTPTIEVVEV